MTGESSGRNVCGRRTKRCRECGHKYPASEYELLKCPDCGANRLCQRAPVKNEPGRACRLHGGESPAGLLSPNYRGKGYSKHIPTRLADTYTEFLQDPEFLGVEQELAIARTLLTEHIREMNQGVWPLFREAQRIYMALDKAKSDETDEGLEEQERLHVELGKILENGVQEDRAEDEFFKRVEVVRRLNETQAKILETKGQLIALPEVLNMFGLLIDVVRTSVANIPEGPQVIDTVFKAVEQHAGRIGVGTAHNEQAEARQLPASAD